jgi:hypothetical protein
MARLNLDDVRRIHAAVIAARAQPQPGSDRAERDSNRYLRREHAGGARNEYPAHPEDRLVKRFGRHEDSLGLLTHDIASVLSDDERYQRTWTEVVSKVWTSGANERQCACVCLRYQQHSVPDIAANLKLSERTVTRALTVGLRKIKPAVISLDWWDLRDMLKEIFGWRMLMLAGWL